MQRTSYAMLASLMLLASCASAPSVQLQPDQQTCINDLPPLPPKVEDAREPDFTETMRSFLRGELTLRSESALRETPATRSTSAPAKP